MSDLPQKLTPSPLFVYRIVCLSVSPMFEAALFDLDGTLIDSSADIAQALNTTLVNNGHEPAPVPRITSLLGIGVDQVVADLVPSIAGKPAEIRRIVQEYRSEYLKLWQSQTVPYDGVTELLSALAKHGAKIGVLTNKEEGAACTVLNTYFPRITFDTIVGAVGDRPYKPDPAGALVAMDSLSVPAEKIVYVGDTEIDIQTGRNAHMYTVGVSWGFRSVQILRDAGAMAIVDSPAEILDIYLGRG